MQYASVSVIPLSQLDWPSWTTKATVMTVMMKVVVSNTCRLRSSGWSTTHPRTIISGITSSEICEQAPPTNTQHTAQSQRNHNGITQSRETLNGGLARARWRMYGICAQSTLPAKYTHDPVPAIGRRPITGQASKPPANDQPRGWAKAVPGNSD
eukprot:5791852-Pyramimonas_sp.AAC.1